MTNVVDRLINDVEFLSVNNITDDARRKNNFAFLVRNSIYGRFQGFVLSQVYSVDIKEKHIKSDPKGLTCCLTPSLPATNIVRTYLRQPLCLRTKRMCLKFGITVFSLDR